MRERHRMDTEMNSLFMNKKVKSTKVNIFLKLLTGDISRRQQDQL